MERILRHVVTHSKCRCRGGKEEVQVSARSHRGRGGISNQSGMASIRLGLPHLQVVCPNLDCRSERSEESSWTAPADSLPARSRWSPLRRLAGCFLLRRAFRRRSSFGGRVGGQVAALSMTSSGLLAFEDTPQGHRVVTQFTLSSRARRRRAWRSSQINCVVARFRGLLAMTN